MEYPRIERVEEYQIGASLRTDISGLLQRAFPGYPAGRIYYKQVPSLRYLAWMEGRLAGHLAAGHRMINAGGLPALVFGISDLCVDPGYQHRQVGAGLLRTIEEDGRRFGLDFLLLIGEEASFYERSGFVAVDNVCRWLSIGDHQSIGIVQGRLQGSLLVKALSGKKWGEGVVDFLGYMF